MTILMVPGRIHGVRRYLGEDAPGGGSSVPPSIDPKPDIDHVITDSELASIQFTSGDEAIAYYNYLVRIIALMTKCAFVTDLWKTVRSSPEMVGALAVTDAGRAWLNVFLNSEAAFLSFTQPKLFQSLQLVRNLMEVNILPKVYKLEVKGRLPAYISGSNDLSYSDVSTSIPGSVGTVNFGDLQTSLMKDDADKVNELVGKFSPKPTMGVWPTAVVVIVALTIVIVTGLIYAMFVDYLEAKKIPPEIRKVLEKADPKTVEAILDKWGKIGGLFAGVADVFMWGAIGTGIIVAGGTILYFATK